MNKKRLDNMNGIYVVILRDGCRVAPLLEIESIFDSYAPNMIKYINAENFQQAFGFCVPMTEKEAIDCAKTIAKAYRELPDGIRILTDYRNFSFEELINGAFSKS